MDDIVFVAVGHPVGNFPNERNSLIGRQRSRSFDQGPKRLSVNKFRHQDKGYGYIFQTQAL